jgi:DNA-directed RNA polymerase specialized sigma24 family protein
MAESDLGETEAQVLAMSELGGMDAVAIAKELGSSRAAVDTALSRARKKIK